MQGIGARQVQNWGPHKHLVDKTCQHVRDLSYFTLIHFIVFTTNEIQIR